MTDGQIWQTLGVLTAGALLYVVTGGLLVWRDRRHRQADDHQRRDIPAE